LIFGLFFLVFNVCFFYKYVYGEENKKKHIFFAGDEIFYILIYFCGKFKPYEKK